MTDPEFNGIEWGAADEHMLDGYDCGMDRAGNCSKVGSDECNACPLMIEIRRVIGD